MAEPASPGPGPGFGPDLDEDCRILAEAGREAGRIALSFFRRSPREWQKGDATVVSEADMAVDAFLRERLLAARPGYGWVSEESASEGAGHRRVFVVDPIDGTRGFLDGTDNWTISMAVVEAGRPVSAVLVQPTRERLFAAALGRGAFLDGAPIAVREPAGLAGTTIAGSRSFARAARTHGVEEVRFIHSLALRIALVAAGEIDAAVTTKGANDWDLAAADLLVHEAGGTLIDLSGATLRYLGVAAPRRLPVATASRGLIGDVVALLAARAAAPVAG